MFDEHGKAFVLEANANPSMAYDAIHTLEALAAHAATATAASAAATCAASAAAGHLAPERVPSDAWEAASYAASLDQRGASGLGRGDAVAHRPSLAAAAAAVVSGGMMKAGGAEGRRRRQEEEARLTQVALGLDTILPPLPEIPLMEEATALCKGRGVKLCRCLFYIYI